MSPSEVARALAALVPTRRPVYLWGPPGSAKSSVVRQTADGRRAFRSVRCPQSRDDLAAEAAGLGWQLYLAGVADPSDLARRAVALARAGRTVCGAPAVA